MLPINENFPFAQVCGLTNVAQSWSVIADPKKFNSNPKDYFARKMVGMVFVVNDEQNSVLSPLLKESLYQILEAYEDEIVDNTTDFIAARFQGKPIFEDPNMESRNVWFWILGEVGENHYHEELLDILEMSVPTLKPLYIGPLDFNQQRFAGLNR